MRCVSSSLYPCPGLGAGGVVGGGFGLGLIGVLSPSLRNPGNIFNQESRQRKLGVVLANSMAHVGVGVRAVMDPTLSNTLPFR